MQIVTQTKMLLPFVKFCKELNNPWLWIIYYMNKTNKNENNHIWTVDECNERKSHPHSF